MGAKFGLSRYHICKRLVKVVHLDTYHLAKASITIKLSNHVGFIEAGKA